jgi:hypothetical protein
MNLDLIKKLFVKSQDQSIPADEAALFFAKAKAKADEAGLELDIIAAQLGQEVQREEMVENEMNVGKRFPVVHKFIIHLLMSHFKVDVLYSGGRYDGRKIGFIGRKSDTEFAKFAYDYLKEDFMRRWDAFKKENGLDSNARNAYLMGLKQGLDAKLHAEKRAQREEKVTVLPADVQGRYQLALVNEEGARKSYKQMKYPKLGTYKSAPMRGSMRSEVIAAGRAAGANININRPLQ